MINYKELNNYLSKEFFYIFTKVSIIVIIEDDDYNSDELDDNDIEQKGKHKLRKMNRI